MCTMIIKSADVINSNHTEYMNKHKKLITFSWMLCENNKSSMEFQVTSIKQWPLMAFYILNY